MDKKTYTKPDIKVYELGSEHASICNTSDSESSTTSELKFCNEEGEEEQF